MSCSMGSLGPGRDLSEMQGTIIFIGEITLPKEINGSSALDSLMRHTSGISMIGP